MGAVGPVGLNLQSVEIAMNHLEVAKEERPEFWMLLNTLFTTVLSLQIEEADNKS